MELKNSDEVRARSLRALEEAIKIIGNANQLGKKLGINGTIVKQWIRSAKYGVSATHVLAIEKLTDGQVKRYELRCDLYPESDTYFFMIKKMVYDVCKTYKLGNAHDLADNLAAVRQGIEIFIEKYLSSPKHIKEILEYTNHLNQFQLHILSDDEWQSNAELVSHAYYALYADICVALYENLHNI